ncbi:MAG: DapH/DapD/GlmU-related protein [Polyangia bacterium]|jgi:acetyltransferase-like isoleucine patch superfamily enzyme
MTAIAAALGQDSTDSAITWLSCAMDKYEPRKASSHGTGRFRPEDLALLGDGVVFEAGVLVFHPEHIRIGDNVYIGHNTILKAYHLSEMTIGRDTWIGQGCFLHSAGGIKIGRAVGIGPMVKILTSQHSGEDLRLPVLYTPIHFAPVEIGDGADIGVGCIVLPGVRIGEGAVVGAGAVVTRSLPDFTVAAGVPARVIRSRGEPR